MAKVAVLKFPEGRYEGEVDEKGTPHGQGTIEYPGNDEYERQTYEGDLVQKKAHGHGIMRWRDGDKYEGNWENGLRHGTGTYTSKSTGGKYEGLYESDVKSGNGKYTYPNGDSYVGNWSSNLRNGRGIYTYKEDGGSYEGDWKDGVKEGNGTYTYGTSGDVFVGIYENNVRHGKGTLTKKNGEVRSENWKEGKLVNFNVEKQGDSQQSSDSNKAS